ncbi:hypothetical protein PHMEG_00016048 [Phytophthora megakarya]|uniref:FHA domain-containing protein n=1 Tax=Phytophthora megakarya TaxID=4795 RepID=A0A225VZY0_9STRA|nr:hypothetical protein PHMEG_00016048 [Phytophthora megakarya]
MDVVHAEITVTGDDYFVRDCQSLMGTFLCLSTRYRHYPQRDGFRLRRGDVFRIGPATSLRVVALQTDLDMTPTQSTRNDVCRSSSIPILTAMKPEPMESNGATNNSQVLQLEEASSTGNEFLVKRMSTVEELKLLAADLDDGGSHLKSASRSKANNIDTETPQSSTSARSKPRHTVQFSDTPPLMSDGSVFLGSRYIRPAGKELHYREPSQVEDADDDMIKQLVGSEHDVTSTECSDSSHSRARRSASIRLEIFQHDPTKPNIEPSKLRDARVVTLSGQTIYLIGTSAACDVRISPSEGVDIRAMHARIFFDGMSFVLEDVSFEGDPRRQTRVLLTQRPVRVTRGDWLLLGNCALYITTVTTAFGLDHRPDVKEAAMRLDVLRLSKRKPRTRGLFVPVAFRLHSSSGSGAFSGSSEWGGSSGGPIRFGKGRDCDAQVFTASLATEQFSVQLERGTCCLTPKPTGINAGTYFLIGRDEIGPSFFQAAAKDTEATEELNGVEIVKHTSKPLLLSEGCVFRCGGCEFEVIYSKSATSPDAKSSAAIEEEHLQFLSAMPWLQPIATDLKTVANVARCGRRLKLRVGDLIYEKGDAANFVFIVITGDVSLHVVMPNDDNDQNDEMVEQISSGGYFGEISLHDPFEPCFSAPNRDDLEHLETAKAASACELLALAREDVCGYLGLYLDIVRAHLRHDRSRDTVIRTACSRVPWLRGISLHEIRMISAHAEVVIYPSGSVLFEDGKLFVPAAFADSHTSQLRDGLLVLRRGTARVVRSKHERHHQRTRKIYREEIFENEQHPLKSVHDVGEEADKESDEWWSPMEPVIAMSSSSPRSALSFCDLSFRLEANSTVECYFVAAVYLAHFYADCEIKPQQLVTSSLHNGDINADDDDHSTCTFDGSDGEGDTTAAHRWRRKKRNKRLLELTVQQTKNDAQIPNALVLYVLAGAQRGDIHVIRNVASIGGLLSGADIELNDRYVSPTHAIIEYQDGRYWLYDSGSKWGTFVRLEEDNAVDINPGDVVLAGEVEFTCLASYPDRNKPSMCCVM